MHSNSGSSVERKNTVLRSISTSEGGEKPPLPPPGKPVTEKAALSTQKFLACITDWVFALFVFFFIFRLPSLGLYRWANNVDTATSRIALQSAGLLVIIFGILWCVAFALKSAAGFLKYLLQSLD